MIQMNVNILHTMGMRFVSYSVNAQKLTHVPNVFATETVVVTLLVKWMKMFLRKSLLLRVNQIVGYIVDKNQTADSSPISKRMIQIPKPVFWNLCNNVIIVDVKNDNSKNMIYFGIYFLLQALSKVD